MLTSFLHIELTAVINKLADLIERDAPRLAALERYADILRSKLTTA